jgi:8-oxo-dGTP diphosphatase
MEGSPVMHDASPLRVVAAAIVSNRKLLLASKRAAPTVFYLPGGKPEEDEEPLATLTRELAEELGVTLVDSTPLALVEDRAALEDGLVELDVRLAVVDGVAEPRAEIAALIWVGAAGESRGTIAPAVRNHVLPELRARGLID